MLLTRVESKGQFEDEHSGQLIGQGQLPPFVLQGALLAKGNVTGRIPAQLPFLCGSFFLSISTSIYCWNRSVGEPQEALTFGFLLFVPSNPSKLRQRDEGGVTTCC